MSLPQPVPTDPTWSQAAVEASERYVAQAKRLTDRSYWPVLMFTSANLFLWHLDAFRRADDPVPLYVDALDRARRFLEAAETSGISGAHFPPVAADALNDARFESRVSGLFSDIWVDLTDDIYFDQSYAFTKERFEKSGVDPVAFFKGKTVLDAGCGSGKFSAAIARFGAKKVIGLDIGEKGLQFAREQTRKVAYGYVLEYRKGSLLEMPLADSSVDIVWSNGVIHHTTGYEQCVKEFARVLKPGGTLFLYVNGRMGLFELLTTSIRRATEQVPTSLFQHFLVLLGVNSGRLYWMMDFTYAPYEYKAAADVRAMLERHGFGNLRQLLRGVASDQIEQISTGLPFASAKYGEGQLKYLATKL